jgi:hypothetical protein
MNMFQEMKRSMDRTQFDLQHQMQETQEHLSRKQDEVKTTLTDINTTLKEGQEKITYLLMHMAHGREPQRNGGNNGASGSHGGEGNYTETSHWNPMKAKAYLEVLITGCQVIAGIHQGLTCLVSWMRINKVCRVMGI